MKNMKKYLNIFFLSSIILIQQANAMIVSDDDDHWGLVLEAVKKFKLRNIKKYAKQQDAKFKEKRFSDGYYEVDLNDVLLCAIKDFSVEQENAAVEIVESLLILPGIDVNAEDEDGETALGLAAKVRSQKITNLLLQRDAKPNSKKRCITPDEEEFMARVRDGLDPNNTPFHGHYTTDS